MITCYDSEHSYMGASFKVVVKTSSKELCDHLRNMFDKGFEYVFNEFKKWGGKCRMVSEQPIKVITEDNSVEIVLEPKNIIAQMFWNEAVRRVKSLCT